MGSPKLLLDLGGKTVLSRLIETLRSDDRIVETLLVARTDDKELIVEAERSGAIVLRPTNDPPEMRDSVEFALAHIEARHEPAPNDAWALIPADHPLIRPITLARILDYWSECDADILVPTSGGRGGHPTLFRWSMAVEVAGLPADCGLNRLIERSSQRVHRRAFDASELLFDLDTPADYQNALRQLGGDSHGRE